MDTLTAKQVYDSLASMSVRPCLFMHESALDAPSAQCPVHVAESRLGCAHNENVRLKNAIAFLLREGVLELDRAQAMKEQLFSLDRSLGAADIQAAGQYWPDVTMVGALSSETAQWQVELIARQDSIRQELMSLVKPLNLQ